VTAKIIDLAERRAARGQGPASSDPPPESAPDPETLERRLRQAAQETAARAQLAIRAAFRRTPRALAAVVRVAPLSNGSVSIDAEAFEFRPDEAFTRLYQAQHGEGFYRWQFR
jgi:hypothetical protein